MYIMLCSAARSVYIMICPLGNILLSFMIFRKLSINLNPLRNFRVFIHSSKLGMLTIITFLLIGIAEICRLKLYSPENGKIGELQETNPGEFSATFECNPGYRMVGEKKITCSNGHWKSPVPWCKCM